MSETANSREKVRFQDLTRLHHSIKPELLGAFEKALETSAFIQGPFVQAFEKEFGAFTGARHCLGVSNGTDAIEVVLEALGIGRGDTVLVPSMTFTATAEAVVRVGATPILVDADPETLNTEAPQFERALAAHKGAAPKALIVVHLYGRACEMDALVRFASQHRMQLIEDCAQAQGSRVNGKHVGTFGIASTFSFYPGKNLGALGDAGAIITESDELVKKMRLLRDHGRTQKYLHEEIGRNARLDGLQAAFLSVKLRHLPGWTRRRQEIAEAYVRDLEGVDGLVLPSLPKERENHVFHNFVIQVRRAGRTRDDLAKHLGERDIETGVHYPIGLHAQPAFKPFGPFPAFPVTETATHSILSLPIDPLLPEADRARVVAGVRAFFEGK